MLSDFFKLQLDHLADMIGGVFGMTDDSGHVIYCSADAPLLQDNLFRGYAGALPSNLYFYLGEYVFCSVMQQDDSYYLFKQLDERWRDDTEYREEAARLLSVASYALANQSMRRDKSLSDLFKRLIFDGKRISATDEIGDLFGTAIESAHQLRLLLVSSASTSVAGSAGAAGAAGTDGRNAEESEAVLSVVKNIFPSEQGFMTAAVAEGRIIVICPMSDSLTDEMFVHSANMVRETVAAEVMVDVFVSCGSAFRSIAELGNAYMQADRARAIGVTFDLHQKYFDYDALGLEKLLFSLSVQACTDYVNETFGESFLKDKSAPELLLTVKTFLDNNQNGSEAARSLYIHRNTMTYRLEKFYRMTGLDCSDFNTGMRVRLAMLVLRYIEKKGLS